MQAAARRANLDSGLSHLLRPLLLAPAVRKLAAVVGLVVVVWHEPPLPPRLEKQREGREAGSQAAQ